MGMKRFDPLFAIVWAAIFAALGLHLLHVLSL